jgi:mannosyltransferase OCH1-like enzyme
VIPRTFHRIWLDEAIPERFDAYWQRLQELHPGWRFVTWSSKASLGWLQNQELFDSFPDGVKSSYAFRADVARYEILAEYGGCYVDTDVEPLRSFAHLFADPRPFIAWCSIDELDPSIIASPAEHPAIRELVDDLEQVHEWRGQGKATSPPGSTGPRYVTPRWRRREDVRRLPPVTFFPYHWSPSLIGERELPWPERSLAVHHWSAGWKE